MKKFTLKTIGAGIMMPTVFLHPACHLLELGDKKILLDMGHTSLGRLVDLKINLQDINAVFVTHFHTDHFADVLPLVHARFVEDLNSQPLKTENKETVRSHAELAYCPTNTNKPVFHKEIELWGSEQLCNYWQQLRNVFWQEKAENYPIKFRLGEQKFVWNDAEIEFFSIKHVEHYQSLAIKITFAGKTLVYTGDMGFCTDLDFFRTKIANADLLIIECASKNGKGSHLNFEEVRHYTKDLNIKQILLTHYKAKQIPNLLTEIEEYPNITLAQELSEINLLELL